MGDEIQEWTVVQGDKKDTMSDDECDEKAMPPYVPDLVYEETESSESDGNGGTIEEEEEDNLVASLYTKNLHTEQQKLCVVIHGGSKVGKTSLAKTLVHNLLFAEDMSWALIESCKETERFRLQLSASAKRHPQLIICSSHAGIDSNERFTINICLYALPPHEIRKSDVKELVNLETCSGFDYVLPVICKADTMTMKERSEQVEQLVDVLVPELQGSDRASGRTQVQNILSLVCCDREYSWGTVSAMDDSVSDLKQLCGMIGSYVITASEEEISTRTEIGKSNPTKSKPPRTILEDFGPTKYDESSVYEAMLEVLYTLLFVSTLFPQLSASLTLLASFLGIGALMCRKNDEIDSQIRLCSRLVLIIAMSRLLCNYGTTSTQSSLESVASSIETPCICDHEIAAQTYLRSIEKCEIELANSYNSSNILISEFESQLAHCESQVEKWKMKQSFTRDRLDVALETCGSWCSDV